MANNYNRTAGAPRVPKVNQVELYGTVQPRGGNDREIKFFQFQNGGGAIHISLLVTEQRGADEQGQPKQFSLYVPVSVYVNKLISAQQLASVRPGMTVRVVGRLAAKTYDNRQTGRKQTSIEVEAFVFEVLEQPQMPGFAPQQPQFQAPQQAYAPQQGYQQAPQYPAYIPQQPQFQAPQQAYAPQQGYQQAPQYPGYAPQQPQYQAGQAQGQQQAPPASQQPGQFQQRQRIFTPQAPQQAPPPYYQAPGAPDDDDLPEGTPSVRDVNV